MHFRSILLAAAAALALGLASPAVHAQNPVVGATGDVAVSTASAKVTAIDAKSRTLTLRGPAGNSFNVVAGPEVRNFAQIRRGDEVVLRYAQAMAIVISKPGTKLPDVAVGDTAARAMPGEKPGAAVGKRVAITGLIVGIDPIGHVLSVVDQHGGPVRNFTVQDPERQAAMGSLKLGEMITVVFTEAVALSVEPSRKH